jgi:hypothetical protein
VGFEEREFIMNFMNVFLAQDCMAALLQTRRVAYDLSLSLLDDINKICR